MIKFDSASIYNRALNMLKQDLDWKDVANDSVISALLKSNAEINAETARYAEYLFKESKWDTAQNESSIMSMANMLGYRPKRNISATGTIYISTDPKILNINQYYSIDEGLNKLSSYDIKNITIDQNAVIMDSNGVSYICEQKTLGSTEKYTQLNITQGIKKSVTISKDTIRNVYTSSRLNRYIYIPVKISNCENSSNAITKKYLKVIVNYSNNTSKREYRVVSSLLLSKSTDYDVEVYNDLYNTDLFYLKFNDDINRGHVLDLSNNSSLSGITVEYVESLGATGNKSQLYDRFTITGLSDYNGTIYGVNNSPISGGKNAEGIDEVKENAPKYYLNNYTAGTKEAYENAILNLQLSIDNPISSSVSEERLITPEKVSVYYGTTIENGNVLDATMVTFIAPGLDDLATSLSAENSYIDINNKLDFYLSKIKSPQDRLIFQSPNYVSYALGVKYNLVDNSAINDIESTTKQIQDIIDDQFGSNSSSIDFMKNYSASDLITSISSKIDDVSVSADITLEAIKKLNWREAERMCPTRAVESEGNTQQYLHTVRIPFEFDSLFAGQQNQKGFMDYRRNASYMLRIDIMYNRGNSTITNDFNTSIFLTDSNIPASSRQDKTALYVVRDSGSDTDNSSYWPGLKNQDVSALSSYYNELENAIMIDDSDCWQLPFQDKVFDDDQMSTLKSQIANGELNTWTSYTENRGCIENFLIYINPDYSDLESKENICSGYIEMDFDSLCSVINTYGKGIDTEILKCGLNNEYADTWNKFLEACDNIVHIFVSMRPIQYSSINISDNENIPKNTILYIDSHDTFGTFDEVFKNKKFNRMISVQYKS